MDSDRITCCGGVAAAEFAMRLIEQTHGTALVNAIAKYLFSQNLRDAGSSQRPERLEPVGKTVPDSLRKAIKIMGQNLETPLPIAAVAQAANISQRQMDRLFAHYVGRSPVQYYRDIRLDRAFYESVGKITIEVKKERNGHVANRLQAALWREAISLVRDGVATLEDVDKAVWTGPGLRWAAMGPTTLFHLGAGAGGLQAFCEHFADTFHGWWDELGHAKLDEATIKILVDGIADAHGDASQADLSAARDALILAMQQATKSLR